MQSRWINHGAKRILYIDFSNLGEDVEALKQEAASMAVMVEQQPKNSVLGLVDFRKTVLSISMVAVLKNYAPRLGPHILRAAVVFEEITGFKRVILGGITRLGQREAAPFDDLEAAKAWLVK